MGENGVFSRDEIICSQCEELVNLGGVEKRFVGSARALSQCFPCHAR